MTKLLKNDRTELTNLPNSDCAERTNLQTIDQAELAQIEGGNAFIIGMIIGGAFVAGVAVGIQLAKS